MHNIVIQDGNLSLSEACNLIERLDRYLNDLYPAEYNHLLPVNSLQQLNAIFLTASIDNAIVGCGALVNRDREYGEIKRMFVLPEFRGLKIGRRILDGLESRARRWGLNVVRLETGIFQPEAISLYERSGYQRCEPFGNYSATPLNIFLEKRLI